MGIEYFEIEKILEIHDNIINISGWLSGYKDKEGVNQVIDFMQNVLYYTNFVEKLAYLIFSISKNHFFNDGNKRTALVSGLFFLTINGYFSKLDLYVIEMEYTIVDLVENKISRDEFVEILKKYLWLLKLSPFLPIPYPVYPSHISVPLLFT